MKQKKFKIVTLGCRTNQYESQAYADQLKEMGYVPSGEDQADLCIINTCTVTHGADIDSRHRIRNLRKKHPSAKMVVTGCMAESDPEAIQKIDEKIQVVPNTKKESLIPMAFPDIEEYPEFNIQQFEGHTRAFVKVQDGCNSFCTYCIIPYVRGRSRSKSLEEVLKEVKGLVANGYKEVVLTGINIGDFNGGAERKEPPKATLAGLVRAVDQIDGLERIRISSIDPDEIDDDLLDAVINGKKTCPSMHIVLQAGSNTILKKMNRKYTTQIFFETLERLKKVHPEFTCTTDIIVGFPGETDEDFLQTCEAVQKAEFAKVHVFPYSTRKRTRAALYPNPTPREVIQKRKSYLIHHVEKRAFGLRQKYVGKTMKVLLESEDINQPGWIAGHTENFLKVWIPNHEGRQNDLVTVLLEKNTPQGLFGKKI